MSSWFMSSIAHRVESANACCPVGKAMEDGKQTMLPRPKPKAVGTDELQSIKEACLSKWEVYRGTGRIAAT